MKKILFLLFLLSLAIYTVSATDPVKMKCIVDSKYTQEDQWVYWFAIHGNEYMIVDSCLLKKGQKEFSFKNVIFEDDCYSSWITFAKCGPRKQYLDLSPGEDITVEIEAYLLMDAKAKGSIASMENYEQCANMKNADERIKVLEPLVKQSKDSIKHRPILDSIVYYKYYLYGGSIYEALKTSKSPTNITSALNFLKREGRFTKEQVDSIENIMRTQYPDSKRVQVYFGLVKWPEATNNSKWAQNRYLEIIHQREHPNTPFIKPADKPSPTNEFLATKDVSAYKIGNKVDDLILPDMDGKQQKLYHIEKKYILIDFWASWCGPCCNSYPELLAAQNKYEKQLTIYAISIDTDTTAWRKAIERLDTKKQLTHVHLKLGTEEAIKIGKQYGVNRIPANFLLDENKKIIATDLRGQALEDKLKSLISQ